MANMFSGNREKKIPINFKKCYETDNVAKNLWVWCERLETLGKVLFWILIISGVILALTSSITTTEVTHGIYYKYTTEETEFAVDIFISGLLSTTLYSFIEYCTYHILALLIGSLATIVQHTKISADIALYTAAKNEGITFDKEETTNNTASEDAVAENIKEKEISTKKCSYCGKKVPLSVERCDCGCIAFERQKCDMCDKESEKLTYAKFRDENGLRYRNLCDDCMVKFNAKEAE